MVVVEVCFDPTQLESQPPRPSSLASKYPHSPLSFFSKCSYLSWLRLERTIVFVMLSFVVFHLFASLFLLPLPSFSTPVRHAGASFHVAVAPRSFKTTLTGTQAIGNVTTFDPTQAVSPHPPQAVVLHHREN